MTLVTETNDAKTTHTIAKIKLIIIDNNITYTPIKKTIKRVQNH